MFRQTFTTGFLRVCYRFLKDAVIPRAPEIIFTQDTLIALVLGCLAGVATHSILTQSAKLSDLAVGFIAYAAIALGFCVGGITIALTLPDRDFVTRLATLNVNTKKGDGLSSLLFVFCWTAFIHWCSVVLALVFLLLWGHREASELKATWVTRMLFGVAVMVASYTLMQFLITALTIWQVGTKYISKLQADAAVPTTKSINS